MTSAGQKRAHCEHLTWTFRLERVTGIEPALSAWEVCGAVSPSPADRLTCGCAYALPVSDPDCPRWLLRLGALAKLLQVREGNTQVAVRLEWQRIACRGSQKDIKRASRGCQAGIGLFHPHRS